MKNTSCNQAASTDRIRENKLKLREKLKLNLTLHEKNDKVDQINTTATMSQKKTLSHVKVLDRIGLVQKEFIQGAFQDCYQLREKIGEGAHASVYKCIQKITGKTYAVKITKHGDEELIQNSKMQYKILKNLNHENIMKAESFYTDRVKMTTYLICELCDYPELRLYMRNRNGQPLSEFQATTIITALLSTLQHLHKNGICHRDIKSENILYNSETKQIKVIDFDCAKNKKESQSRFQMWTKTGTIHYQAPQYFTNPVYTEKVDIWAVGVLAYELITGELPFKSSNYQRMIKMIVDGQLQIALVKASEDFKFLLRKLLEKDAQKRYSARECLRLPAILKSELIHLNRNTDDFDLQIENKSVDSPRSCTQLVESEEYISLEMSTKLIEKGPPILKYFCFVPTL